MEIEKKTSLTVRLPDTFARRFKAALALKGLTAQEFFEVAARRFVDSSECLEISKNGFIDGK